MKTRVAGSKNVLTDHLSEPLNGATAARIDIQAGDSNLTIDRLNGGEQVLASGTLQYLESQDLPTRILESNNGQATLTLRGGRDVRPRFRLPWSTCNGATEWQIHLNPTVSSDITAQVNGGNVMLNLAGMPVSRVSADTGGGNLDVVLPEHTTNLDVTARTGGGNVSVELGTTSGSNTIIATSGAGSVAVHLPVGLAARIQATTGIGKVIVDQAFLMVDKYTYQSPDYDSAADRVEITAKSGAGNVTINTKSSLDE